jgi:hypothetical protein
MKPRPHPGVVEVHFAMEGFSACKQLNEPETVTHSMSSHFPIRCVTLLLSAALLIVVLSRVANSGISHDEHQFIVPGILTVEKGLLPYRDFPAFHTPYLMMLNGAVAHFFEYKMLAARVVTGFFIWLSVCVLGLVIAGQFRNRNPWVGLAFATGLCTIFVFGPVWAYTICRFWNHGAPMFFVLCALALHFAVAEKRLPSSWLGASGLALGIAAGMRLTCLPLLAPFGLSLILMLRGETTRERLSGILWFGAGAFVALLPMVCLLAWFPEQVIFGNLHYPKLSVVWREFPFWAKDLKELVDPERGFLISNYEGLNGRPLSIKLKNFAEKTFALHLPAFAIFLLAGLPVIVWHTIKSRGREFVPTFLLLTLPFVWWGCVAPSRYNKQYYYALFPFLLLSAAYGLSRALSERRAAWAGVGLLGLCTVAACVGGKKELFKDMYLARPATLSMVRFHTDSNALRYHVPQGKVLTLEPMAALEAGLDIYPEFVMGEFAWRSSHLVPADKRRRMHLISPYDLEALLAHDPPAAVYLDKHDKHLNVPLREYAERHGFQVKMHNPTLDGSTPLLNPRYELWVAPQTP